ncbi:MAG: Hdr-like menaquinol oxidoreductase cytochrome c subunit [Gammaproteobacteria bacterium]|nr:Hdr-like menaquinol oxidoreductase cytochrome c subunit [Gammaproteobacteria bacterium]MBU1624995.1 Hdr-like menaquinol oxidoreductase cytochrome c subunit [Gammaproteobacteria bacterium]MBU1981255.1 Hdr-like menaquinol oxidoreductase cytochrome c subunit [Gammaproteobacteria bacterium]
MRLLVSLLLTLCVSLAWASEATTPKLDIGKGGQCVEDTQWMRKNHMHLLKHARDDALRRGIRDEKRSLKVCIECHASTQDNSVIAREDSFCVGCHKFEAVKLDCFECHSGTRKSAWLQQRKAK